MNKEALWEAINHYCVACGGSPATRVYGNTERQRAVVNVERIVGEVEAQTSLRCAQLSMVASQLARDPKMDHDDRSDPRWTPALHEAWCAVQKHKEDAAQIVDLLGRIKEMPGADSGACEEFEASGLEVAANPEIGLDCQGTGWYLCRDCARYGRDDEK